jgi:hypothetical protein
MDMEETEEEVRVEHAARKSGSPTRNPRRVRLIDSYPGKNQQREQ